MSNAEPASGETTSAEARAFQTGPARPVDDVIQRHAELTLQEHQWDADLKRLALDNERQRIALIKTYGKGVIKGMGVQVVIADLAFFVYGFYRHWNVPVAAIDGWLSATVVQVIAVALVIARSLFPNRDDVEKRA